MAYDEKLAERIRKALTRKRGIEERTLFGCYCLLLNGNVLVGVWKNSLIIAFRPRRRWSCCCYC
jgi:hypothetical protein